MATGSARGNRHRCGALEGKAVVTVCKTRQNVSSDAPNETKLRRGYRKRGFAPPFYFLIPRLLIARRVAVGCSALLDDPMSLFGAAAVHPSDD